MTSVFQNLLVTARLEEAAINTLIMWFPTYLREVERQQKMIERTLPTPANYTNRDHITAIPGEPLPKIVVVSPGTAEQATKDGAGQYRAKWALGVTVATAAQSEEIANAMVKCYAAAIRGILVQKQTLGGFAREVTWQAEAYEDLPIPDQISLYRAASLLFYVDTNDVVTDKWAGPDKPDQLPHEYGQVEHVIIDIEKLVLTSVPEI